mgnify:CR=1 FL=1
MTLIDSRPGIVGTLELLADESGEDALRDPDLLVALGVLIVGALLLIGTLKIPFGINAYVGPRVFPMIVSVGTLALGALLLVATLRGYRFIPATDDGTPIRVQVPFTFRFAAIARRERVAAHVRVHRHGVRPVADECLARVHPGGVPDVASLGVEDDRNGGVVRADVLAHCLELLLGAGRRKVGDLGFVRADHILGRVDDLAAEGKDRVRIAAKTCGEATWLWVETDAQQ